MQYKLLHEATIVPTKELIQVSDGLQEIHGSPIYIMGENVIECPNKKVEEIEYETSFCLQKEISENIIKAQYEKYLHWFPGVSEILFFSAMFGVVKPFLHKLGIDAGFTTVLIGPPAHLKTTLIRQYALWLEPREQQEIGFYFAKKNQQILEDMVRCLQETGNRESALIKLADEMKISKEELETKLNEIYERLN